MQFINAETNLYFVEKGVFVVIMLLKNKKYFGVMMFAFKGICGITLVLDDTANTGYSQFY